MPPYRAFLCLLVVCATGACTSSEDLVGRQDLQVVRTGELPPPDRDDQILQQRPYVIGPFDKVEVYVYGVSELNRTVQVDANGQVSLPLAGQIEAAGKTPAELAEAIADSLRGRYIRDPQVTVNADTVNQMITVDGAVEKPGLYPVTGRMTLMRAIATAEGLSEFARENYVVVFRRVDGQEMAALYDLRAVRQGMYPDPEVFANDVLYVGESQARRWFRDVLQASGILAAPLVTVLNNGI